MQELILDFEQDLQGAEYADREPIPAMQVSKCQADGRPPILDWQFSPSFIDDDVLLHRRHLAPECV